MPVKIETLPRTLTKHTWMLLFNIFQMCHCLDSSDHCELIFECQTFFQTPLKEGGEDTQKVIKLLWASVGNNHL